MEIDADTGEIKYVFLRSAYNYDTDEASQESGLYCPPEEGMTQQQFKDECDINTIVERFGLTGELPETNNLPVSGDFTEAKSFEESMLQIRKANEAFMEFPAHIRAEFNNDPGRMIAFLEDEDNRDKALKMGIIQKPPERTRDMIQAVDELKEALTTPKPEK